MSEELPKVHTEYNDGEIIDDIKNRAENAEFIDIRDTLTENKDKQIYYKNRPPLDKLRCVFGI